MPMPAHLECKACGEYVQLGNYLAERGEFLDAHSGPFDALVTLPVVLRPIEFTVTLDFSEGA